MNTKKRDKFEYVIAFITWALSCFTAFKAGEYMLTLLRQGAYFANAGFWNCVGVGFLSIVAIACGTLCVSMDLMQDYFKISVFRRLVLLTLFFSNLIGAVGIAYVICDFFNFQLGIFDFGKIPWFLGVCVSLWSFSLYFKGILSKVLTGVFFGGRRSETMLVPQESSFALDMGDKAMEKGEYGYAERCYQSVIERAEKQSEFGWDTDTYTEVFSAGSSLAKLYWDGEHIKRDPQIAVKWAERVMKHEASGSKHLMGAYGNVEVSRRVRDRNYEEDMQKLQTEYQEKVDEARWNFKYFANNAIALSKILYLAYGAGDGVEKNPEKSAEYFAKYIAYQQKLEALGDSSAHAVVEMNDARQRDGVPSLAGFPRLIYDDWSRQWLYDWDNGEEARYILSAVEDQKTDIKDSLSGGVAYLKIADMAGGSASYLGRTFHW